MFSFLYRSIGGCRPWMDRHCTRANVWIATFSFIGNWWFTHYFYNVLEATYTMPAHDVNAVPWAMFFATHFYFTLYHALASKVCASYISTSVGRSVDRSCIVIPSLTL